MPTPTPLLTALVTKPLHAHARYSLDLQTYIPMNAWFADIDTDFISEMRALSSVRWVDEISAADKIAPHIKEVGVGPWAVNLDGSVNLLVTFFDLNRSAVPPTGSIDSENNILLQGHSPYVNINHTGY